MTTRAPLNSRFLRKRQKTVPWFAVLAVPARMARMARLATVLRVSWDTSRGVPGHPPRGPGTPPRGSQDTPEGGHLGTLWTGLRTAPGGVPGTLWTGPRTAPGGVPGTLWTGLRTAPGGVPRTLWMGSRTAPGGSQGPSGRVPGPPSEGSLGTPPRGPRTPPRGHRDPSERSQDTLRGVIGTPPRGPRTPSEGSSGPPRVPGVPLALSDHHLERVSRWPATGWPSAVTTAGQHRPSAGQL